jgi:hypothetical protein
MMSQKQYSVLYWVTLFACVFSYYQGRDIVGTMLFVMSGLYLIAGDFAKRWEKSYGECKAGESNQESSVVETST